MILENLFRIEMRMERDEGDKRKRALFCHLIKMGRTEGATQDWTSRCFAIEKSGDLNLGRRITS